MSHFTVLVISKPGENWEDQLKPYQENNMGTCPKEYMEFEDMEDEMLEEYKTKTIERILLPDGQTTWSWDERFRIPGKIGTGYGTHKTPDNCKEITIPFTQLYSTFEDFANDYHGFKSRDLEKNRFGYWKNPNAKWDWYKLGGRWTGYFPLKLNAAGIAGEPGLMTEKAKPGYVDLVQINQIDFERMRNEVEVEARKDFKLWKSCFEEFGKVDNWKMIKDRVCGIGANCDFSKMDEARKEANSRKTVNVFNSRFKEINGHFFWDDPVEEMGYDEEAYVKRKRDGAVSTFAIVKDGVWYEKATMGWWAITSNETMTQEQWDENFNNLLNDLPPETMLALVDCHI